MLQRRGRRRIPQPDHPLMISLPPGVLRSLLFAGGLAAGVCAASAQSGGDQSPGLLDGLFGGDQGSHRDRLAQSSASDLSVRIDGLEAQVRQMTGVIEELQFRNQQMADQLRRLQGDAPQPSTAQQSISPPPVMQPPMQPSMQPSMAQQQSAQAPRSAGASPPAAQVAARPAAAAPGRRGDAFDPAQNPNAPGVPRTLGTVPVGGGAAAPNPPADQVAAEEPPVAAPGGRVAGEPLNLSTMSANSGAEAGYPPPSGGPPPAAGGTQVATLPPSDSPKDYYDLAYGYALRKDYALAADGFRTFLRKYPSDRMAPEAEFWLGESLFQQQRYRDAAEAFLNVSTKYESAPKAPDALLRLGQSLAYLGEKEAACASLGEVLRKYPRAALAVKQGVDREQKRDGC